MYSVKDTISNFISNNKFSVGSYLFLSLLFPLIEVLLPQHYGIIIDGISKTKNRGNIFGSQTIRHSVILVVSFWVVMQILIILMNWMETKIVPQLQSQVRKDIVMTIIETFKNNYRDMELGSIISKIVKLPIFIRDLSHQFILSVLPMIAIIFIVTFYFAYIDIKLSAIYTASMLLSFIVLYYISDSCVNESKCLDQESNKLHESISDIMSNLVNIYSADSAEKEIEKMERQQDQVNKQYNTALNCSSRLSGIYSIMMAVMFLAVNGYSISLYNKGTFKLPTLISVIVITFHVVNVCSYFSSELKDILYNIGNVKAVQAYFDKLQILAKEYGNNDTKLGKQRTLLRNGNIVIKNLDMRYENSDNFLFKGLNLKIPNGQTVLLLGHNGSGKSSLIKTLLKLNYYQSGTITIGDQDISKLDSNFLRKQLIYVDQRPKLFNRSIYENIVYGNDENKLTPEVVSAKLKKLKLDHIFKSLDKSAGKNGSNLSGGQQQIIYLLRCLFKKSPVVFLDEPTSALDAKNKEQIFMLLSKLMLNKTVIMVTHDPFLTKFADRTITLKAGRIITDQQSQASW